jgi:hypothetical protein
MKWHRGVSYARSRASIRTARFPHFPLGLRYSLRRDVPAGMSDAGYPCITDETLHKVVHFPLS